MAREPVPKVEEEEGWGSCFILLPLDDWKTFKLAVDAVYSNNPDLRGATQWPNSRAVLVMAMEFLALHGGDGGGPLKLKSSRKR